MKSTKKLLKEAKKLAESIEKSAQTLVTGATLKVIDLSLPYNHMFSAAAKRGMTRKVTSLSPEREIKFISTLENKAIDKIQYLAVQAVGEEKLVKCGRIIAEYVNKLASHGYVTGCLAPLSAIELCSEPHELNKYAVFCFVSVTEDGSKFIEKDKPNFIVQVGEVGPIID